MITLVHKNWYELVKNRHRSDIFAAFVLSLISGFMYEKLTHFLN